MTEETERRQKITTATHDTTRHEIDFRTWQESNKQRHHKRRKWERKPNGIKTTEQIADNQFNIKTVQWWSEFDWNGCSTASRQTKQKQQTTKSVGQQCTIDYAPRKPEVSLGWTWLVIAQAIAAIQETNRITLRGGYFLQHSPNWDSTKIRSLWSQIENNNQKASNNERHHQHNTHEGTQNTQKQAPDFRHDPNQQQQEHPNQT